MDRRAGAPIVLVHGLLGFDRVKLGPLRVLRYFPGIEDVLTDAGHRVAVPNLAKTRSVSHRAEQLRQFIVDKFPNESVHVIAHSMGGLDARHMISRLDMHERVLSLTTIGTPHRGTVFADWTLRKFGRTSKPLLNFIGVPTDAWDDLTTDFCARFNEQTPNVPGVHYYSVAGSCSRELLTPLWRRASELVEEQEGPNDGVVSVQSARHGDDCEVWDSDHMNLVNRPNPRAPHWGDRPSDYLRLIRRVEP
jgi:triacylglycerol lipase